MVILYKKLLQSADKKGTKAVDLLRNYGITGVIAGIALLVTGCGGHLPRDLVG